MHLIEEKIFRNYYYIIIIIPLNTNYFFESNPTDQLRNSYQVGYDSSLRVIYANGMDSHYQTEPHILAGAANPTVARRNMSLPGENGQNLVEWRFRKEQTRGKVIVFGRKLRVSAKKPNTQPYPNF